MAPGGYPSSMGLTAVRKQRLAPRELVRDVAAGFQENRLLTYASAISFQATLALPAFLLFAAGLLGFLHLDEVWTRDVAPGLKESVSQAAFALIDDTVRKVLAEKQLFWVTI